MNELYLTSDYYSEPDSLEDSPHMQFEGEIEIEPEPPQLPPEEGEE